MIVVPEKTIACIPVIPNKGFEEFNMDIDSFLKPLNHNHKRDWFTPHFYHCLPLSIGNMQGFVFSVPFDFEVFWNGGPSSKDLLISNISNIDPNIKNMNHVNIQSEFGNGIFTMHFPLILKTPPGVNLITIAPPNFPTPGISPMTGVIETDNLRFTFSLSFKVDLINTTIKIAKDYPIMGILPIPRNYCDSFELVNAYNIFDKKLVEEEREISDEHDTRRQEQNLKLEGPDLLYYKGMDIRKNKFKDHQLPKKDKK